MSCYDFSKIIDELFEHKNRQIDENRKISRRIDDIEKKLRGFLDEFGKIDGEIKNLSRFATLEHNEHGKSILDLDKRLREVERFHDITYLEYDETKHDKKPFRCPVCDGKPLSELNIVKTESGNGKIVIECHGCNGSSIVWG